MIDGPVTLAALLAALSAAGVGFVLRRTAPPVARWLGFVVAVAFVVIAVLAPSPQVVAIAPSLAQATLDADARPVDGAALQAAARSGPRGVELRLQWAAAATGQLAAAPAPAAALGAVATAPPPLPFEPDALRVRCVGECAVERPLQLELSSPPLSAPFGAELVVRVGADEVLRQRVDLGAVTASTSFAPRRPGSHTVELRCAVDGHEVLWRGAFDVAPADEVLVVERGDVVAAALRAQGLRVRAATTLPETLRGLDAVVLATPVPSAAQTALATALHDGLGLFVLAAAFGDAGAPLRADLPVRPLPAEASGAPAGADARPVEEPRPADQPPPADESPKPPPRDDEIGATGEHAPVSSEEIEVDKHAVAMVLVIDRSGSMGNRLSNGRTRMDYAKASAWRTATALSAGDRVGIVTFGDKHTGRVELQMTDATDLVTVRAGIERLQHAPEMTYLLSGLQQARQLLRGTRAAVKHVVVVSDGEFVVRDGEGLPLSSEARGMRNEDHITVSVIAIAESGLDQEFRREAGTMARAGGGELLPLESIERVPAMVSAEVTRALSKVGRKPRGGGDDSAPPTETPPPPQQPQPPEPTPPEPTPPEPSPPQPSEDEPASLPVYAVAESPLLAPEPAEWPRVAGVTRCEAPLDARVLLVAGEEGWPLLCYANRGLGRVGAFAADLAGADMPLRDDANFPAWLAQWVRAVAPSRDGDAVGGVDVSAEVSPPAPTTHDLAWLAATAGAAVADHSPEVDAVLGVRSAPQVAGLAGWLLLALLLLAVVERLAVVWSVRRGRAV